MNDGPKKRTASELIAENDRLKEKSQMLDVELENSKREYEKVVHECFEMLLKKGKLDRATTMALETESIQLEASYSTKKYQLAAFERSKTLARELIVRYREKQYAKDLEKRKFRSGDKTEKTITLNSYQKIELLSTKPVYK